MHLQLARPKSFSVLRHCVDTSRLIHSKYHEEGQKFVRMARSTLEKTQAASDKKDMFSLMHAAALAHSLRADEEELENEAFSFLRAGE